jgi:O-antigen/teichoic acid export membrane protein
MIQIDKKFLINFSWLNAASVINKVISFVYVVVLVKLLPQASFGIYNLVWAQIGLLGAWQDLGTTPYGLLQDHRTDIKKLNNIFTLRIILAFVVAVFTTLSAIWLQHNVLIVKTVIFFSGFYLYIAISGFFLIITALQKKLTVPSVLSIIFNTVLIATNTIALWLTRDVYAVFKITAVYYLLYGIFIYWLLKKNFFPVKFNFDLTEFKKIIKGSLIFTLISFANSFYLKSNTIMLGKYLGPVQLAIYSAAYKFYEVPQLMVANYNFSSIPTFKSYFLRNMKLYRLKIKNDSLFLLLLGIPITVFVWLVGGILINFFFSQKYHASIQILNILVLNLIPALLVSVFLNALYAQQKEKWVAVIFMFLAALNISLNYLLIPVYGINATAWLLVLTQILSAVIFGIYLFFILKHGNKNQP